MQGNVLKRHSAPTQPADSGMAPCAAMGSADGAMRDALGAAERELAAVIERHAAANPALAADLSAVLAVRLDQLHSLSARLGAVEALSLRLIGERSPDILVSTFIEAASAILAADYLTVCLVDAAGLPRHLLTHGFDAASGGIVPDSIAPMGTPAMVPGVGPGAAAGPLNTLAGMAGLPAGHPAIGCLIGQPVRNADGQHGWMTCARKPDTTPFGMEDEHIAASLAALLAAAYVSVASDVSALRDAHHQVAFLSNHDQLTLLPNRSVLAERMRDAIAAARHGERQIALMLFNLDRLQRINDSLGHEIGDAMLQEMARRAGALAGEHDTLAHMGGDEFVLLLTDCVDSDAVVTIARRLIDDIARPVAVGGHDLIVTASIGISIYPRDGTNPSELLKAADVALSHMKDAGRNGFRFFKGEMNAHALRWMSLETHLRRAIERGELSLHYQPQVSIADGTMCSMEALLRWRSPELGQVAPGDFIAMAEDTGLILPIGNWVIRQACLQNKAWQDAGLCPMRVAVNVSAHQFMAGTVPEVVADALRESGLEARYLEVELTESVMMHDSESTAAQLADLTSMGVSISLDDFGTGYSSLGYLSRFMLDKLKIDQSFVRNITTEPRSAAIAQATVALAHGLSLDVIAEGVETEGQLAYLKAIGCDEVQGYLFSRPVPPEEMARLLSGEAKLLR